ncbi:hypothetical protein HMPREF1585_00556 [Gardnerella vaginalis JCP8481B]|nr:hypothetical protein HMPREF1585_00556 [Gardnerella vaginalis JCP8481B]
MQSSKQKQKHTAQHAKRTDKALKTSISTPQARHHIISTYLLHNSLVT